MMKFFLSLILFFSIAFPAMADETANVEKLIKTKMEAALLILKEKSITKEAKNNKILSLVEGLFDFSRMAKLTLGRKYWGKFSKQQKVEFTKLFTVRLKRSYLDKLNIYSDEKPQYRPALRVKNKIKVLVSLVSNANKISLLYKLYKTKKKDWLVYDIEVQGVSIISTYRSQFNQILSKGSVDELLKKLMYKEKA